MVAQTAEPAPAPAAAIDAHLARMVAGEQLTRDEILDLSHAVIALAGLRVPRQGGYSAKMNAHLLALDNMPALYSPELKADPSPAQQARMDSGIAFEDDLLERWKDVPGVRVIEEITDAEGNRTSEGKAAKEAATFAAYLDPQVRLIANARMGGHFSELVSAHLGVCVDDEERVSEPDAIELGPLMANGLRAMRFVDIKWHKTTESSKSQPKKWPASPLTEPFFGVGEEIELVGPLQKSDWMQLSHYYRHGESLHVVDADHSLWAAIIGKEEVLVWARLDEVAYMYPDPDTGKRPRTPVLGIYDRCFTKAMETVVNAVARNHDPRVPALTSPEWNDQVKESGWKQVCLAELESFGEGGHITLLPGVTSSMVQPFYDADILDVATLARMAPGDELDGVKNLAKHVYQARVCSHRTVALAPEQGTVNLALADIEVDFDYEAAEVVYQRGVRVTGQLTGMDTYDDFTGTEDGEAEVFAAMWARFNELLDHAVDHGQSIRFYHYTAYERTQDLRLAKKYEGRPGIPTPEEVIEFYASDVVVDLYEVLSKQLVWPTKSHSIKDLAKFIGFAWRGGEGQNGDESTVWYDRAVNDPDPAVRGENVSVLRIYNEDDVVAQTRLRDWVGHRIPGTEDLPHVEDLPAPEAPAA